MKFSTSVAIFAECRDLPRRNGHLISLMHKQGNINQHCNRINAVEMLDN